MTNSSMAALQEVQRLDHRIRELEAAFQSFEPRLAEAEGPALELESELGGVQQRLAQMQADLRRLERSGQEKDVRIQKLEERLTRVQNLREEAAVQTELSLIQRARGADDQESLQLMDQIQRAELVVEELERRSAEARAEVEPSQQAILDERQGIEEELAELRARRDVALEGVGRVERRVYDSFHASGRPVVVARLMDDGACGHCYSVVPLQIQQEIRAGTSLIRCEACGVILSADLEVEEPRPVEPASVASADGDEDSGGATAT